MVSSAEVVIFLQDTCDLSVNRQKVGLKNDAKTKEWKHDQIWIARFFIHPAVYIILAGL